MNEILRLSVTLAVIAVLSGFAIGLTHQMTEGRIQERVGRAQGEAVAAVVPPGTSIRTLQGSGKLPATYWAALRDSVPVAYAFEASSRGYASDIRLVAGIDTSGIIIGLRALEPVNETPGMGTRIAEVVSRRYLWEVRGAAARRAKPWFTEQFEGLDINKRITLDTLARGAEWHTLAAAERRRLASENRVTAVTGATVSSRAVVRALETEVYGYLRALRGGEAR